MGRRINSIRTSRHMTQQELANTSGLDRTYISMVEHGKQNLTIGAALRIADALGVPIGHLIEPEGGWSQRIRPARGSALPQRLRPDYT